MLVYAVFLERLFRKHYLSLSDLVYEFIYIYVNKYIYMISCKGTIYTVHMVTMQKIVDSSSVLLVRLEVFVEFPM